MSDVFGMIYFGMGVLWAGIALESWLREASEEGDLKDDPGWVLLGGLLITLAILVVWPLWMVVCAVGWVRSMWASDKTTPVELSDALTHPTLRVGDRVRKVTGDYHAEGHVRTIYATYEGGPVRAMVAIDKIVKGHIMHTLDPKVLERVSDAPEE